MVVQVRRGRRRVDQAGAAFPAPVSFLPTCFALLHTLALTLARSLPPASWFCSCLLPPASCLLPPASCLLPPASCLLAVATALSEGESKRKHCIMLEVQGSQVRTRVLQGCIVCRMLHSLFLSILEACRLATARRAAAAAAPSPFAAPAPRYPPATPASPCLFLACSGAP